MTDPSDLGEDPLEAGGLEGFEARMAREDARRLAAWEEHRGGRPVRLWEADIEVRCAAVDEGDAWHRLTVYLHRPYWRVGDACELLSFTLDLDEADSEGKRDVEQVPDAAVEAAERTRLELGYPRGVLPRPDPGEAGWDPFGPDFQLEVAEYVAALRLAAHRAVAQAEGAAGEHDALDDVALAATRPPLPAGTRLGIWRAVHRAAFLAGEDEASARARAEELARTIVDYAGRPLGRVLQVAPDDGFRSAKTGKWLHPAEWNMSWERFDALWDDYDAAQGTVASPAALAEVLRRAADDLQGSVADATGEHRAFASRLHVHADGTRTLSSSAELDAAALEAQATAAGRSPAALRKLAEEADYLADRVYGKVVETDDDLRRIERLHHQAAVYRQLAETPAKPHATQAPAGRRARPAGRTVKLRLWGTEADCAAAVEQLRATFDIVSVSRPRRDRPPSTLVRVYVEVSADPTAPAGEGPPERGPAR